MELVGLAIYMIIYKQILKIKILINIIRLLINTKNTYFKYINVNRKNK